MKTMVTMIPTNLVTNLILFLFCPFVESKNKNQISSKLVICFFIEFFLHVITVRIITSR